MIPIGVVSASIRSDILTTFPETAIANPNSATGLAAWLTVGAYSVTACDKHQITFEVADDDFASMLLSELELYTDQSFEQLQEIISFSGDARVRSDAWNLVAVYYFGFFAAQIFLRLIGRPTYFLDKTIVAGLQTLSGSPDGPGAGAFYVERVKGVGANRSEYKLRKSKEKIHESCWKTLFNYLTNKYASANLPPKSTEAIFYSSLQPKGLAKHYHVFDWPPLIRARANYEAGFAYLLVANKRIINTKGAFQRWAGASDGNIHALLYKSAQACDKSAVDDFLIHASFLFDIAYTIFHMTRDFYVDLLSRRRLDRRWELRRSNFRKKMSTLPANAIEFAMA